MANLEPDTHAAVQAADAGATAPSARSAMLIVFLVVFIDLLGFGIVLPLLPRISKSYVSIALPRDAGPRTTVLAAEEALPEHTELIGYSAAALSLVALLLGLWLLPETRRFGESPSARRKWFDFSGWRFALATAAIGPVVLTFFLATLGFGGFEATLSLLLQDAFLLRARQSFLIFAYVGLVLLFTQGFIYRRLATHLSEVAFMGLGIAFMGLGIAVLGLVTYQANSGQPREHAEGLAGLIVGLLMSSFSLMQFLFAPVWGRVSDRAGRRPILLVGLAGSVAFYALFGYACSLPPETAAATALVLFFVSRIGAGIAGATISTAQAVIADCTPPERRKHGMALIGAAFGIGFTFGPLIGSASLFLSAHEPGAFFSLAPSTPGQQGSLPLLFTGLTAAVVGFAFLTPSAQALISRRTPSDRQGEILGVNQSAAAMARILGPVLGITLYELTATHLLPYAFGAAVLFLMLPMLLLVRRGEPQVGP
jgi:MFS family permease